MNQTLHTQPRWLATADPICLSTTEQLLQIHLFLDAYSNTIAGETIRAQLNNMLPDDEDTLRTIFLQISDLY